MEKLKLHDLYLDKKRVGGLKLIPKQQKSIPIDLQNNSPLNLIYLSQTWVDQRQRETTREKKVKSIEGHN
jgi:P pilus assembly chaperone PapD